MPLTSAIDAYLTLKRSLGAGLQAQESILRAFGRAVGDIPLDAITAEACATFCRGTGAPTRGWENKHQTLRSFCTYLVSRGYLAASPLQEPAHAPPAHSNRTSTRTRNSNACCRRRLP